MTAFVWEMQIALAATPAVFTTYVLPEPVPPFNRDPVWQGSYHEMLSGKIRRDIVGKRNHFGLKWDGLTQAEADSLLAIWTLCMVPGNVVKFKCHLGTFTVIVANTEPETYDAVGYVSTGVVLEETL